MESLKEKMINHIREITGNPKADLQTLQFDPNEKLNEGNIIKNYTYK